MKNLCKYVAILLWFFVSDIAYSQTIPKGVNYRKASSLINQNALKKLEQILVARNRSVRSILGKGTLSDQLTIVGYFLTQKLNLKSDDFLKVENRIPLDKDITATMNSIGLRNEKERNLFSKIFSESNIFKDSFSIRMLTSKEMSLIWTFIGWDIEEPTFVAANKNSIIVFAIRPDNGVLKWIEDISSPCVQAKNENKILSPCFCFNSGWVDENKCKH